MSNSHPPSVDTKRRSPRPVLRNISLIDLMRYRMPAAALLSILHRVSGALMFFALGPLLYVLSLSLQSPADPLFTLIPFKLVLSVLVWALAHHLAAGVRHLLSDLHIGLEKHQSRQSALIAFFVSALLTLIGWFLIWNPAY